MGKILAVDYGEARVGIAISNSNQTMSFPRDIINIAHLKTDEEKLDFLILKLKNFIENENCEKIIIGLPLFMDGSDSDQTIHIREITEYLQSKIKIDIELYDERLSTESAYENLINLGVSKKKRDKILDSVAATKILQEYLDCKK